MKIGRNVIIRVIAFFMLLVATFFCLNSFFQPVWLRWNNYHTTKGFYVEPDNTIETVFLGASIVLSSVTPMEMYNDYGICTYNMAGEQQPMLGSYYWLEEVHRHHSDTLKTVVLDASGLRSASKQSYYHKSLDNMKLSDIKLRAVYDYCDGNLKDMLSFMVPILSYHGRWSSLEESDFDKYSYEKDIGTRGYYYLDSIYTEVEGEEGLEIKNTVLDEDAEDEPLLEESLKYLDMMVKFCKENNLELVLMKTVAKNWSSGLHNAVAKVADAHGIEFIDFNYDPLYDDYGYIHIYDTKDGRHMNYYGATKFSEWMGKYLVEEHGATDVRENPKYDFMKDQYKEYTARVLQHAKLLSSESVVDYLDVAVKGENTVMLAVKLEAAGALTKEDRKFFSEIGLEKLSKLKYRDSYIGVIENGKVIYEDTRSAEIVDEIEPIAFSSTLPDGKTSYKITSGGFAHGNTASIHIGGDSVIEADNGLNIAVYSNELGQLMNATRFNTMNTSKREAYGFNNTYLLMDEKNFEKKFDPETIDGKIMAYTKKVNNLRDFRILQDKLGEDNLFGYLDEYWKDNVIMISLYNSGSDALTDKDRKMFKSYGLKELAKIQNGDSYVAFIENGKVLTEERVHGELAVSNEHPGFYLKSGSAAAGKASSITVYGEEWSNENRGLNIVVYNRSDKSVLASMNFDTHSTPIVH